MSQNVYQQMLEKIQEILNSNYELNVKLQINRRSANIK